MGCCNQGRSAAVAAAIRRPPAAPAERAARRSPDVAVRYTGAGRMRVRGTATGRTYTWAGGDRTLAVDPRDVAPLVRSGLFQAR